MSRNRDYIPWREAELVSFVAALHAMLSADPGAYGLDRGDVDAYGASVDAFVRLYDTAREPLTRTSPAIARKDEAKRVVVRATRRLVDVVQAWPGMTDDKRLALGISIRSHRVSRVPVPEARPSVTLIHLGGRDVSLEIAPTDSPHLRKPAGVSGAMIFTYVGVEPPTDATQWQFASLSGRTRLMMTFDAPREACTVWIAAAWFNGRKEAGPMSSPRSVNLPATAVVPVSGAQRIAA